MSASSTGLLQAENSRVYLDFYALSEPPFAITPDPAFLYLSPTHQETLEKLLYGIGARLGFLLLTGEVGTGKTTLCRHLLDLLRDDAETVYLINPALSVKELVAAILDDLDLGYPQRATKKMLIDQLHRHLVARDERKPVVLIIDDAQAMSTDTLESLRLLSNLETDKQKLLQILLVGQPELVERISQPQLRQLQQRISLHCRIELLDRQQTEAYIGRRLYASGSKGHLRFTPQAVNLVLKHSHGIPRLINKICDYALVSGYLGNDFDIGPPHVKRALQETGLLVPSGESASAWSKSRPDPKLLSLGVMIGLLVLLLGLKLLS